MALIRNKPRNYELMRANGLPVAAGSRIFEGGALGLNAGTVRPLQSGDVFAGFALEATRGPNARLASMGRVALAVTGAGSTSLGASVYASDDDTFGLVSGSLVGYVERFEGDLCMVAFDALAPGVSSQAAPTVQTLAQEYAAAGNPKFAPSYTWATLPAPALYTGPAYVSDIGLRGSLWRSDGSTWGLVDGHCVLESSAVAKAAVTGSTTETLVHIYAMPAALLGMNGELEFFGKFSQAGALATRTVRVRLGGIAGAQALNVTTTAANLSVPVLARVQNRGVANSQIGSNGTLAGLTGAGGAWATTSVDTSAAVDVAITVTNGNAADSITLEAWQFILRRP